MSKVCSAQNRDSLHNIFASYELIEQGSITFRGDSEFEHDGPLGIFRTAASDYRVLRAAE